ncbi:MAG: DUF3626 domain-containing protein [Byssovorax sp.]
MVTQAQSSALDHVKQRAQAAAGSARTRLAALFERSGLGSADLQTLLRHCQERARVTLNFHPDRPCDDGRTVAERLLAEGQYRSQFVTGISSGSRTAFAGGDRDRWEEALFGGAYHQPGILADERPRYGGLDLLRHGDGACPRFGSCYFELRAPSLAQCTFTWGDSHTRPEIVGTIEAFEPVLAALLEGVEATGEALGVFGLDVASLTRLLTSSLDPGRGEVASRSPGRALDAYIEAQIHGTIDLARDVAALVIDPSFVGTEAGDHLGSLAAMHGFALHTHRGFVLRPAEVPADFRGPRMVPLAAELDQRFGHGRGAIDASVIGRAARSLHEDPESFRAWGSADEARQLLKQLWHVLVRYGRARADQAPRPTLAMP